MKRNHAVFFIILCVSISTVQCMNSSNQTSSNELPAQSMYDCQKLKSEFSCFEQLSRKEKNALFDIALKEWFTVRHRKYLPEERFEHAQKHSSEQKNISKTLACLICYGVNPNRVVVKNVNRSEGYGVHPAHETRDYLCSLEYAVETDNANLASFLVEHGALTHINVLTWLVSVKDRFFGESPKYAWTITREKEGPLLGKIRSVAMAKILVPHIGLNHTFRYGSTIAHVTAENNNAHANQLLEYYLDLEPDLADKIDKNKRTPLHALADNYPYVRNKPNSLLKTKLCAQKTKNINALDVEGYTAYDKVEQQYTASGQVNRSCFDEFVSILEQHGGEGGKLVLSWCNINNALQKNDHEGIVKILKKKACKKKSETNQ